MARRHTPLSKPRTVCSCRKTKTEANCLPWLSVETMKQEFSPLSTSRWLCCVLSTHNMLNWINSNSTVATLKIKGRDLNIQANCTNGDGQGDMLPRVLSKALAIITVTTNITACQLSWLHPTWHCLKNPCSLSNPPKIAPCHQHSPVTPPTACSVWWQSIKFKIFAFKKKKDTPSYHIGHRILAAASRNRFCKNS